MSETKTMAVIGHVLKTLRKAKVPPTKILMHKFLYFLDVSGLRAGLRFEPYTYGPFSFDLARELDDLIFWDRIEIEDHGRIRILEDRFPALAQEEQAQVEELYKKFSQMTEGDMGFKSVEIVGTILYCGQSLKSLGESVNEESVLAAFKEWKGDKYPEDDVRRIYENVHRVIQ